VNKMNLLILFILNTIFWCVIFIIFDIFNRIPLSNFFNKNTKCYYYKKINKKEVPNILRNDIKINANGESRLYNERGKFIIMGIVTPIYLLLLMWPLFYKIPNMLATWCIFNSIIILLYSVIFVFIRFKINKTQLIDENYTHYISYTLFSLKYNIANVVKITFYVLGVLMSGSIIPKIILAILIVHLHAYIFIDKIDSIFNLNILEKNKLDKIGYMEYSLTLFLIGLFFALPINTPNLILFK